MTRYIAFLRAINVGGHVVKMTELRRLFESAGMSAVETFIASGNVIFEAEGAKAADLETALEAHLESSLGYAVGTYIRTPRELRDVVDRGPFAGTTVERAEALYISFLRKRPTETMMAAVAALDLGSDEVRPGKREIYWLCRDRYETAKRGPIIGKALRVESTARNVTTVRKIVEKYCRGEANG